MNVSQCDNCKRLDPAAPPPGWLLVVITEPDDMLLPGLFAGAPKVGAMFCGWKCAAEYAVAKALIDSAGKEPGGDT
jgi:hypothetical protein